MEILNNRRDVGSSRSILFIIDVDVEGTVSVNNRLNGFRIGRGHFQMLGDELNTYLGLCILIQSWFDLISNLKTARVNAIFSYSYVTYSITLMLVFLDYILLNAIAQSENECQKTSSFGILIQAKKSHTKKVR